MDLGNGKLYTKDKERVVNVISVGITWVDGRLIFKHDTKHSKTFYGICHFNESVFAITPLDWPRVTLVTTIKVSPTENFCERSYSCLSTTCPLNNFDKNVYAAEFKDCGLFSLGLPNLFNKESVPWWGEGKWKLFWGKFILKGSGGILRFDENKANKILQE